MIHLLLTGAGFSRNWGGWLVNEAFEYLIGCSDITPLISANLWKSRNTGGGYEDTLEELRTLYEQSQDERHRSELEKFEAMLLGMFHTMNNAFSSAAFEPAQHERLGPQPTFVRDFLCRFDAVFTLNQDTLLERHYQNSNLLDGSEGRWFRLGLAGLQEVTLGGTPYASPGLFKPTEPPFAVPQREQPYFKLHGSSNWRHGDGSSLLIMGGKKDHTISGNPLLRWYRQQFQSALMGQNVRLMTIGYGFGDEHINADILTASANGMKLFIVDPIGIDVLDKRKTHGTGATYRLYDSLQVSVIGASRRPLLTTLTTDLVERGKILRFFT